MIILRISLRNILRQKRRSLFCGITMSVGLILVSLTIGLTDGSYSKIIELLTGEYSGHIQIHKKGYLDKPSIYKTISKKAILNFNKLDSDIMDQILSYSYRTHGGALAFHKNKSIGIVFTGIDVEKEMKTTTLLKKIVAGSYPTKGAMEVVISKNISEILKLKINDNIIMISGGVDGSVANDIYKVVGVLDTTSTTIPANIVLSDINTTDQFFSLQNKIHEIVISLKNYHLANEVADHMREKILNGNGLKIEIDPWPVVKKDFYKAMLADKKGSYVSLVIIMIIVSLGILNTILMSIFERTKEYGLLKALGTRPSSIFILIFTEVTLLSILSSIPALIISYLGNLYFVKYGIAFDPPIEYGGIFFDTMKSVINLKVFLLPFLLVVITSIVVTIIPALKAARTLPSQALRTFG